MTALEAVETRGLYEITTTQRSASLAGTELGNDEVRTPDVPPARPHLGFGSIDKSLLALSEPRRVRDKAHLKFVAGYPCLICGRQPADPHHLRFAQPRALGRKVSDEFTVPLCRTHHREVHRAGKES